MDRIDAMQAFVAVADLRGFAPAARKLRLSPSAVTRLIAALEERLGARLLQRTTRSVTLTDAGTRYLERARRILADVEEAELAAEGERTRPSGRLVVSAPVGFGRLHVSPVMAAYLQRYGDVSAELRLEDRQAVGSVRLERTGTKSVTVHMELRAPDGRLAAEAELVIVSRDPRTGESQPLTEEERAAFESVR